MDVVISSRTIPLVNHILERIGYTQVMPEKEEPSKKDTPSRQNSSDSKEQPALRRSDQSPTEDRNSSDKPSVIAQLEANRRFLEQQERETAEPVRRKKRNKDTQER